jgi:hypothetical protein
MCQLSILNEPLKIELDLFRLLWGEQNAQGASLERSGDPFRSDPVVANNKVDMPSAINRCQQRNRHSFRAMSVLEGCGEETGRGQGLAAILNKVNGGRIKGLVGAWRE